MWILLLWGRKEREKILGYVADFCPVCRRIQAFTVSRIRLADHIYFIPLERGTFLEYRQTCQDCRSARVCHLGRFVRISTAGDPSIELLVQETFPTIREAYQERLEFEDRIASGLGATAADGLLRKKILMEAFEMAAPHFEHGIGLNGRRLLANALRPLNPTEEEVRECLQHFRRKGHKMGGRLRTRDVLHSLVVKQDSSAPDAYGY